MGFDISWVGSPDLNGEELTARFRGITDTRLMNGPDDKAVLMGKRCSVFEPCDFSTASKAATIYHLRVHEGIMVSIAEAWSNSTLEWRLFHDGDKGLGHIDVSGAVPSQAAAFIEEARAKATKQDQEPQKSTGPPEGMPQTEFEMFQNMGLKVEAFASGPVDYLFDVPIQVMEGLTGFRHDREDPKWTPKPNR